MLLGGLVLSGALLWSLVDVVLPAAAPVPGYVLLALLVPAVVALCVGLALAPAAAALEGLGATAALQRSWTLVQGVWWRTTAYVTALVALNAGAYLALRYAMEPTGGAPHALAMSVSSGNTYFAYTAAQLAPSTVALPGVGAVDAAVLPHRADHPVRAALRRAGPWRRGGCRRCAAVTEPLVVPTSSTAPAQTEVGRGSPYGWPLPRPGPTGEPTSWITYFY
ncbi:hypothetical protein [Streptomyces sp. C3-3]|uniref:hypothetical protein n=1 Tax=Streptomyces sp. C3-3 TaxID=2824901 RepID=UPI001B3917D7|nr:hypothetical protein [Streptomyces sp. C3-3]MBQ1115556.1 hypothetical protein [Streptomyces sp. C3-3]